MTPDGPTVTGVGGVEPDRQWWGLGDVAVGILGAQVLSIIVVVSVFAVTGWESSDDAPLWAGALLQIPLWVGLAGATVHASHRKGLGLREDFGLTMVSLDAPVGFVIGVLCQLVLLPVLYWPLLKLLDKSSDDLSAPAKELADRAGSTAGWVVLFVMVVICAPLVEELFYRGLLLRALEKARWPSWAAVLGSAVIFAGMHFQLLQFPGLFVFGVVLAVMAMVTGRLGPAIWAHAGFNAATVVLLYISA